MTPKQTALAALTALPDDATWDAVNRAEPYVVSPEMQATLIRRSEEIRTGKVQTISGEELFQELDEIIASYENQPATASP